MADVVHPRVYGEVRVVPFECTREDAQTGKVRLLDQLTIMIVVPSFSPAWFRLAGGMLIPPQKDMSEDEHWAAEAQRELVQETGVIADPRLEQQLAIRELKKRQRHYPGEFFPVQYRMVFNCRFDTMFTNDRTGDEGEIPVEVTLREILEDDGWEIPDNSGRTAYFYKPHLEVLHGVVNEVMNT